MVEEVLPAMRACLPHWGDCETITPTSLVTESVQILCLLFPSLPTKAVTLSSLASVHSRFSFPAHLKQGGLFADGSLPYYGASDQSTLIGAV